MALDNPNVRADVVEVQEFPLLAQRYMVSGVPKTIINNKVQFVGAVPEPMLIDYVLKAVGVEAKEQQPSAIAVAPEVGPSTRAGAGR
ncbi:MAG: thioredoxin family protein [Chloroflexi bacterium]|nr:thioredoxin family protein [Chloroflexota bacterium]MBI4198790.1 thioredoxin family protein [Chloroflexota bacterium]